MITQTQDFTDYESEYEKVEKEILVLISDLGGGAVKIGDSWQSLEHILAYVETETSELKMGDGQITWLISEEQIKEYGVSWPHHFKTGTIYRLIVRELKDKTVPEGFLPSIANRLMIVKVLEENAANNALLEVLAEYRKPVLIVDEELGEFELNKDLRVFTGKVNWCGKSITTYLDVKVDNQTTWKKAIDVLRKYHSIQANFDLELRQFAADRLIETAKTWEENPAKSRLTLDKFAKRISLSTLSITSGGKFKFDFFDDNIFLGHTIRISGSSKSGIMSAEIVG